MIKNIIFDLGGVLLNIDYHKSLEAFEALGYKNFEKMFTQFKADELFQNLETGKISANDFYEKLRAASVKPVTNQQLENAWNAMLISMRKESIDFLKILSPQFRLFLLSNTNEIHYAAFTKMLQVETGAASLEPFFIKTYYSHEIHLRKPDRDIYEFVLKDTGILAAETLFIDDTITNFPEAEKLGIKTHLLLPEERIETIDYTAF